MGCIADCFCGVISDPRVERLPAWLLRRYVQILRVATQYPNERVEVRKISRYLHLRPCRLKVIIDWLIIYRVVNLDGNLLSIPALRKRILKQDHGRMRTRRWRERQCTPKATISLLRPELHDAVTIVERFFNKDINRVPFDLEEFERLLAEDLSANNPR